MLEVLGSKVCLLACDEDVKIRIGVMSVEFRQNRVDGTMV